MNLPLLFVSSIFRNWFVSNSMGPESLIDFFNVDVLLSIVWMYFFVSIKNVAGVTELNDECGGNDRWPYHMAFLDATSHCYGCTWNNKIMLRRDSVFMCSSMHFMNTCGTTAQGIITIQIITSTKSVQQFTLLCINPARFTLTW